MDDTATNCEFKRCVNPSNVLRRVVELMESHITRNNFDRHSDMIKSFLEKSQSGVIVSDLFHVTRLLDMLANRVSENSKCRDLLHEILTIVSIPPQMIRASDVLSYARDLTEYFTVLGTLLVTSESEEQYLMVGVLKNLLKEPQRSKNYVSLDMRAKAMEQSELPTVLANYLVLAENEIYADLLELVSLAQKISTDCCKRFLLQNTLNTVLMRLSPEWKKRAKNFATDIMKLSNITIEVDAYEAASSVIWSLIGYIQKNKNILSNVELVSRISLWSLRDAFKHFALNRYPVQRNDILALITQLVFLFPKMDFVASKLAEDVASISIFNVDYLKGNWASEITLTACEDDYIFYKLMLISLPNYVKFEGGTKILEDLGIISRLLNHIKNNPFPTNWSPAHRCVMNLFSWNIIKKLAPHLEEDFIENIGPSIMLNCLKKHESTNENLTILIRCLDTLNTILKNESSNIIQKSLIYNDGVACLLDLSEAFLLRPICLLSQKCIALIFCLLKRLDPFTANVPFRIVDITLSYMQKLLVPDDEDKVVDSKVLLCIVDFIWDGIERSEEFTDKFLKKGGVYNLLDLLQNFPYCVQLHVLGLLADFCENENCVPYLLTWKNKGESFLALLMKIFRQENDRLCVKSGTKGQIGDVKYPLMGKTQWIQTYCQEYNFQCSPTMADMFLSCRPRIYAILTLLNERHREKVSLVKEQYPTTDELSAQDQVTMLLAENYFALKLVEAWKEIVIEFEKTSFMPYPSDQLIVDNFIGRMQIWINQLKTAQMKILETEQKKQMTQENNLYAQLREARLENALDALTELKYIARSTERMFRVSEKYNQNTDIRSGMRKISSWLKMMNRPITETYMSKLKVTPVFNQDVNIVNTSKIEDPYKPLLISPSSSKDELDFNDDNCYL